MSLDQVSMAEDSFLCVFTMFKPRGASLLNFQSTDPCLIETLVTLSISSLVLIHLAVIFFLTFHFLKVYLAAINADQKQLLPDFMTL